MLRIALAWLLLALVCQGCGHILHALWHRAGVDAGERDAWRRFWMGLAFLIALLLLLNLVVPLAAPVSLVIASLSLGGFWWNGKAARPSPDGRPSRSTWASARNTVFWAGAASLLLVLAMKSATWRWTAAYDTDLYHFSWVRWAKEYAAVPGLANLHCRLGQTYSGLLLAAFIDHGWWERRSAWVLPGFVLGAASLQWLHLLVRAPDMPRPARWYALLTIPYLMEEVRQLKPSLYSDTTAHLLVLVAGLELLRRPPGPQRSWCEALGLPFLLVSAAYAVKALSVAALFVMALAAALAWIGDVREGRPRLLRGAVALVLLPCLLVLGVVARNSVCTGWPFYPGLVARLPVDWAVPRSPLGQGHAYEVQSAEGVYRVLKAWARRPGPSYSEAADQHLREWWPVWARENWHGVPRVLFWAGVGCALTWCVLVVGPRRAVAWRNVAPGLLVLLVAAASLLFWFFTAPDVRYGLAFFWIWFAAAASLLLDHMGDRVGVRTLAIALLLALLCWLRPVPRLVPGRPWWNIGQAKSRPVQLVSLGAEAPFTVYVPVVGDQCGDAPLPCTPYPLRELRLRVPGELGRGFRMQVTPESP